MRVARPYSLGRRLLAALGVSAIAAPLSTLAMFGVPVLATSVMGLMGIGLCKPIIDIAFSETANLLMFAVLFAVPVALVVAIPATLLAVGWLTRRGEFGYSGAAKVGALCGLAIGLIELIGIDILIAVPFAIDPNFSSGTYMCGLQTTRNGLPTLLGLVIQLAALPISACIGAIAGLLARAVLGSPSFQVEA